MRSLLFTLISLVSSACAYLVLTPGNADRWTTAGPNTVTWQMVNTDPQNFAMLLVNQVRSRLTRPLLRTLPHSWAPRRTRASYQAARSSSLPSSTAVSLHTPSPHLAEDSLSGLASKSTLSRTRKTQTPFSLSRGDLLSPSRASPPRQFPRYIYIYVYEYRTVNPVMCVFFFHPLGAYHYVPGHVLTRTTQHASEPYPYPGSDHGYRHRQSEPDQLPYKHHRAW